MIRSMLRNVIFRAVNLDITDDYFENVMLQLFTDISSYEDFEVARTALITIRQLNTQGRLLVTNFCANTEVQELLKIQIIQYGWCHLLYKVSNIPACVNVNEFNRIYDVIEKKPNILNALNDLVEDEDISQAVYPDDGHTFQSTDIFNIDSYYMLNAEICNASIEFSEICNNVVAYYSPTFEHFTVIDINNNNVIHIPKAQFSSEIQSLPTNRIKVCHVCNTHLLIFISEWNNYFQLIDLTNFEYEHYTLYNVIGIVNDGYILTYDIQDTYNVKNFIVNIHHKTDKIKLKLGSFKTCEVLTTSIHNSIAVIILKMSLTDEITEEEEDDMTIIIIDLDPALKTWKNYTNEPYKNFYMNKTKYLSNCTSSDFITQDMKIALCIYNVSSCEIITLEKINNRYEFNPIDNQYFDDCNKRVGFSSNLNYRGDPDDGIYRDFQIWPATYESFNIDCIPSIDDQFLIKTFDSNGLKAIAIEKLSGLLYIIEIDLLNTCNHLLLSPTDTEE